MRLDSIGVTGGVGTVEVSGGLKWYRDSPTYGNGIKGGLRAKFMKGKIDILATAQFGSVGTNKYWYVDAMAAKEGGWNKPSAFTIYGFGGGAWYHMSPLSSPPPAESITQQELTHLNDPDFEPGLTLSGMNYTPNAGIDLGFKATIVFGDPSSGYAYNGNITALAQFAGGGLQSIGLTTDVYMLHKKEADGVIEGHVPIKGHGEILFVFATDVFTANFDMFVDVRPNLLVGTGPDKKAGQLEILITPDTWHFYIGRPESRVGLKIAGFVQSGSYFMVGDDLPGVPPPPPNIASLVPADYLVREDISDASGLAFGTEVSFADTGDFLVFRYKVNGLVGFDLLFTASSEMECAGIEDPGIGPFYARGQLYGAVNAAVSIFVDLWVASGEKDIFTVGVAGMFQCGFANPSWLKGFAHGHYDILWGAVKGEATVPFQAGHHCEPPQSNLLDDMDSLGDLSPADRSGLPPICSDFLICGVDCGVEPQAVFNVKIDQPIDFNEVTSGHQVIPHTVRVVIVKFELKNELGQIVQNSPILAADRTRASLHPPEYLTPKKQHSVTIVLRAEELIGGQWRPANKSSGGPAIWERTHTFKTDGGIEELKAENLDYTYPFHRQRFVLQDECRNAVIRCDNSLANQPVFKSPYGKRRSFKIVITSMTGGTPMEQAVTPKHNDNSYVAFTLPQLANSRTYSVKLVAKDVFDASNLSFSADGPAAPPSGSGQSPAQQIANVNLQTMSMGAVASNVSTSNQGMVIRTNRVIQGYALRPDEKLLYEYHFRTSNYNTLPDKVTALVNTSTEYTGTTATLPKEVLSPSFTGESFDTYDLVGFKYGPEDLLTIYPLIGVQDAKSDLWHTQFAKPILYDYYAAIKASDCSELELQRSVIWTSNGFITTTTYRDHPDPVGIPPFLTVNFHPLGPLPSSILSDSEVAPSTTFAMNPGNWSVSANGPATGPPITTRLQYKTGEWVVKDYQRLQTITPDVISHCGPLNHYTGGDDVYYEMAEPLRSYVIAFQNTPYKRMFNGAYAREVLLLSTTALCPVQHRTRRCGLLQQWHCHLPTYCWNNTAQMEPWNGHRCPTTRKSIRHPYTLNSMARSSLFLFLLLLTSLQLGAQSFHVIARNHADSLVLRWAPGGPCNMAAVQHLRISRGTLDDRREHDARTRATRVGPDTIRPWTLEKFIANFPPEHPYAGPVVQLLYGEQFVKDASVNNLATAQDASTELTMRYSFTLLMADMDAPMAQALGLRFADHDVQANAHYLYRVIDLGSEHPDTAIVGVNRSLGAEVIPPGPTLYFDEEEAQVRLKWEKETGEGSFSAYWVERADMSGAWKRLHATPFLPTMDKDKPSPLIYFSDSTMERNYMPHRYRVLGITPFGELSTEAPIVTAMGRDRTPPTPPLLTEVKDEKGKLVVHWEQGEQGGDLTGYRVEKAPTALGGHYPLHAGVLPKNTASFTDTSSFLVGENHYRVAAIDTAGNVSYSNAGYGSLIDSIAPAAPFGVAGAIDTTGLVTLHWPLGKEPDLLGYRVFFANAPDHEFNNVTPYPVADTLFRDTLHSRRSRNVSTIAWWQWIRISTTAHSVEALVLTRPDIVPPVAPVFKNYLVTDSAVTIHFIPSSSNDVARHELQRKEQTGTWSTVLTMAANDTRRTWTDTTVNGPAYYSYQMLAVDSAGNISQDGLSLDVRVHERLKRDAVRQVTAVRTDDNMVHVSWDPVPGKVKHYVIFRSKDTSEPMPLGHALAGKNAYDDIRLTGKGSYTYLVQAVYEDGSASAIVRSQPALELR